MGLYRDNGEENGNYHSIVGYILKTASYFAGSSGRAKGCSVLVFILIAQRSDTQHVDSAIWAFAKTKGTLFAGPRNEDYSIFGPICGSPYLGKLPHSIYRAHLLEALSNHSNEAAIMGVLALQENPIYF